jgi:hypothetical protein
MVRGENETIRTAWQVDSISMVAGHIPDTVIGSEPASSAQQHPGKASETNTPTHRNSIAHRNPGSQHTDSASNQHTSQPSYQYADQSAADTLRYHDSKFSTRTSRHSFRASIHNYRWALQFLRVF